MKVIFFVLFILIISNAQSIISNEEEGRSIIQINEEAHEFNGTISLPLQTSKNLVNVFFYLDIGFIIELFNDDRKFIWKW